MGWFGVLVAATVWVPVTPRSPRSLGDPWPSDVRWQVPWLIPEPGVSAPVTAVRVRTIVGPTGDLIAAVEETSSPFVQYEAAYLYWPLLAAELVGILAGGGALALILHARSRREQPA